MNLEMNVYQNPSTKETAVFNDKDATHTDKDGVQWVLGSMQDGVFVKAPIQQQQQQPAPSAKPILESLPKTPIKPVASTNDKPQQP